MKLKTRMALEPKLIKLRKPDVYYSFQRENITRPNPPTDIRISILKGFADNSIPSNQFITVRNFPGHAFACLTSNPEVFPWNIPRVFQKCSCGVVLEYSKSVPVAYS